MNRTDKRRLVMGAGVIASAVFFGATAVAQPVTVLGGEVNISGATLMQPFFLVPASTNDYIDVDGDGFFGFDPNTPPYVDQLAASFNPGQPLTTWWQVQYRGVGSVNGFKEFIDFNTCGLLNNSIPGERGYFNRYEFARQGVRQGTGPFADCNGNGLIDDSGTPVCATSVDLAILDVESSWASVAAGDPAWNKSPASSGYGLNPIVSATGYLSNLQRLSRDCSGDGIDDTFLNTNTANPDQNTVFDTRIAWAPIVYIANRGAGVENIRMSDLHSLFVTGRMPNGENLVAATRSVGSGTRNGIMNTSGIDPSWGMGDNEGSEQAVGSFFNLGPTHQPTNAESSSNVEDAVRSRRLAVGYTGLAGAGRAASDAVAGLYEVLNVMFDDRGGMQYVRPTINTVLDNLDPSVGYQLGGTATFTSIGDPGVTDPLNPAYMNNQAAASYLRNIMASVAAYVSTPANVANVGMPGEYLALSYFGVAGLDALPNPTDPAQFVAQTPPAFNQSLQDYIRANNGLGIGGDTPSYGLTPANFVPRRNTLTGGAAYSDGSTANFINPVTGAADISSALLLNERNRIAGDFNYAGAEKHKRNLNDIAKMMEAVNAPRAFEKVSGNPVNHGGQAGGIGGDYVIPEIIGDFTGDGNFDFKDVRYFGDGLSIDPATGKLDRKKGFVFIDQAWEGLHSGDENYFDTTIATAKPYAAGDSRADIAGAATPYPTPGGNPKGSDGIIDGYDVDWVCENANAQYGVAGLKFAIRGGRLHVLDLSADINGDLSVDIADLDEIVHVVLGTEYGDVNLDGRVDAADAAVINGNLGNAGGWAGGDLNCDGQVTAADHDVWALHDGFVATFLVPPVAISAASVKSHAGTPYSIPLPLGPALTNAGVECRSGGPTQVVVTYDQAIGGTPNVTLSAGTLGVVSMSGSALTINISGVPDATCLSITINGITCATPGSISPAHTVKVGSLYGDVNGNRAVNAADIGLVKSQSGQPVTGSNFKYDLNFNGSINAADIGLVKSRSGQSLAACAY